MFLLFHQDTSFQSLITTENIKDLKITIDHVKTSNPKSLLKHALLKRLSRNLMGLWDYIIVDYHTHSP